MPTHCTITRFGFRASRIDGVEYGLFSIHATLGQNVGRVWDDDQRKGEGETRCRPTACASRKAPSGPPDLRPHTTDESLSTVLYAYLILYIYIYICVCVCVCVCVCKVFCPEAGPSLEMHYQGSTYLSLLDKRKEWGSMSSPFLTEPVTLWEYLSLHTQTQECCKYNYQASPYPKYLPICHNHEWDWAFMVTTNIVLA